MSGPEQRSRRAVLASLGAGGAALCGGCLGVRAGGGRDPVSVLAAGSLQLALGERLPEVTDVPVTVEAHGSVTAARLVAAGQRDPDIVALADTALFPAPLAADWHVAFATNSLVVAVDAASDGGRRVRDADRWFDPVLAGDAALGRTDPDLDPLGYRTLFALRLAGERRDRPDLADRLAGRARVYPETSLLSRLETGALDAAVVYRSMAVERGYEFRDLPAPVDFGSPAHADRYRTCTYDLPDGRTVTGDVIAYGATARTDAPRVAAVFDRVTDGSVLESHGFELPRSYPRPTGDVPDRFAA